MAAKMASKITAQNFDWPYNWTIYEWILLTFKLYVSNKFPKNIN